MSRCWSACSTQLIEANLAVADGLASRYAGRGVADEDLAQVARLALVRAAAWVRPDPRL